VVAYSNFSLCLERVFKEKSNAKKLIFYLKFI
jgi:hypothetical protein